MVVSLAGATASATASPALFADLQHIVSNSVISILPGMYQGLYHIWEAKLFERSSHTPWDPTPKKVVQTKFEHS